MHATRDKLKDFATGRLARDEAADIEAHLQQCESCGQLLDEIDLSADQFIGFLRNGLAGSDNQSATASSEATLARNPNSNNERSAAAFAPTLVAGSQFGRYRIERGIGQGGMGLVYEAYDLTLHRNVALKIIHAHRVSQQDDRVRFRREAESAARLQHANIVQIFEFGEQDQTLYCAFELIENGNLAERVADQVLSPHVAARLVATLADAVEYAHQRQIIHRDLKPANILFTADDTPKIADFGLARRLDEPTRHTLDGTLLGSPSYMAPEQARGDLSAMGPAVDIYALGAVLYEAIVGRPPFHAAGVWETLEQVKHAQPISPAKLRPNIDRDLATICLKCLEKAPSHRYLRAADVASDLRRFADGLPIRARPSTWWERLGKLVRRHPRAAAFTGLFGCVLLAFLATVIVYNALLVQNNRRLVTALDEARRHVFAFQMQRAAVLVPTKSEQAQRLLLDDERCPRELRDFWWEYLATRSRRELASWHNDGEVHSLVVAPDRASFVTGDERGVVRVWSVEQTEPTRVISDAHRGPVTEMALAPNGTEFVTVSEDGTAKLWTWPQFDLRATIEPNLGRINGAAYSRQGHYLATAHSDGFVRVWSVPATMLVAELSAFGNADSAEAVSLDERSVLRVSFSADDRYLVCGTRGGSLPLWTTQDWETPFGDYYGFGTDVQFHPQATDRLVFANDSYSLQFLSVPEPGTLRPTRMLRNFTDKISDLAFSEDGELLAVGSYDGTTRVLRTQATEVAEVVVIEHPGERVSALAFQGTRQLLTGTREGRIRQWNLFPNVEPMEIAAHAERAITGLVFAQDGETLLSGGADGAVRAWRVATGKPVWEWSEPLVSVSSLVATASAHRFAWEAGGTLYYADAEFPRAPSHVAIPHELLVPQSLTVSRQGKLVALVDMLGFRVVDIASGQETWRWEEESLTLLTTSPTSELIAAVDENNAVWVGDLEQRRFNSLWQAPAAIRCLTFDAAGRDLAVGLADGSVAIVNRASGDIRLRLRGHGGAVEAVAYSPDGKTIATGGSDGDVRLWDAVAGPERGVLPTGFGVATLVFSPDSRMLSAGGNDGVIRIWKAY